jgi:hypothetical protein
MAIVWIGKIWENMGTYYGKIWKVYESIGYVDIE